MADLERCSMNNEPEHEWDWHNGRRVRLPRKRGEKLRDELARCAARDAERVAAGEMDAFLNAMDSLPVVDWKDKYFSTRGRKRWH
jgi:hypothetical protein